LEPPWPDIICSGGAEGLGERGAGLTTGALAGAAPAGVGVGAGAGVDVGPAFCVSVLRTADAAASGAVSALAGDWPPADTKIAFVEAFVPGTDGLAAGDRPREAPGNAAAPDRDLEETAPPPAAPGERRGE
jgi:hypothetical protein